MKKFLLTLLIVLSAFEASAQINVFKQDSLGDKAQQLWGIGQTNIFNDPRTPRFVMASKDQNYLFGVGGYVEAKGFYDFSGLASDGLYLYDLDVPYNSKVPHKMGFMASGSKLIFKLLGNTKFGVIETTFETAFESVSYNMYLSRAYIRFGHLLLGQDWSVMTDTHTSPTILDGADPVAKFGYKVPQISYSFRANDLFRLYLSLEFPNLIYQYNDTEYYIADLTPDFDAKVVYNSKSGVYTGQFAAIARIIKPDVTELTSVEPLSKVGYGFTTAHQVSLAGNKHVLYASGSLGVGINDQFAGLSGHNLNLIEAQDPNTNQYSLISGATWGVIGAYKVRWDSNSESNLACSYLKVCDWTLKDGSELLRNDIPDELLGASVNYIYTLEENMIIGVEALVGTKTLYNGNGDKGFGARIGFLLRYNF